MTINDHLEKFAGKQVEDFEPERGIGDPRNTAYRLSLGYEAEEAGEKFSHRLAAFLDDPAVGEVEGLVIGAWERAWEMGSSEEVVESLVAARDKLTGLKALFLGDITCEESEISWITQSDVGPLLQAYPQLEEFGVRGNQELSLGPVQHEQLKTLVVQTGGLSAQVVRQITASKLPQLEHLELWLGSSAYGGDTTLEELAPILSGELFPQLRYLGLRDSEEADALALALATAPILKRIETLDLSLGNLSDEGAAALLNSPDLRQLEKLDLHFNYLSEPFKNRLGALGIQVDTSQTQEPDDWGDGEIHRYIAVSE